MQNFSPPKSKFVISPGLSSSHYSFSASENHQLSPFLHTNPVCPDKQCLIHYTSHLNNINELTKHFPNNIPEISSAYSAVSNFTNKNKVNEASTVTVQESPAAISGKVSSSVDTDSIGTGALCSSIFSTPGKALHNENHYENEKDLRTVLKGDVFPTNNAFCHSANKAKSFPTTYKSPSSDFVCSECGFGFPCTLFLCKRSNSSLKSNIFKTESKSININCLQNWDFINSIVSSNSKCHDSSIANSSENISNLENKEIYDLSSSRSNVGNQMNRFLFEKENKCLSDEDLLTENKIHCVNDSDESKDASDIEILKNIKNASSVCDTEGAFNEDVSQSHIACKDFNDVFSLFNIEMASPFRNFPLANSNKQNYNKAHSTEELSTLSEETRNFLNELEASSTASNTFTENISGYLTVTPRNSQSLSSKMGNETVSVSESNNEVTVSDDNKRCNISDEKDVTNALDLIEQSSLYDRNLSSAEICNSLNQIFSESNVPNLSVTEATNVEIIQTEETADLQANPVSVCVNNESGIYLHGIESNVNLSGDSETYINLSDLCAGSNADNVQSILLIQDDTGNVESMFLIQDSANNAESIIVSDGTQMETVVSNQYIAGNIENIVVDTSENIQNLFVTQDIVGNGNVLITPNSLNQTGLVLEDSCVEANMLISQGNMDQNHVVTEKLSDEIKNVPVEQPSDDITCINVKNDTMKEEFNETSTQNMDKEENVSEDSSDKVENILLTLSNHVKTSVDDYTQNVSNVLIDQCKSQNIVADNIENSQISESSAKSDSDFQHSSIKLISKLSECNTPDNFRNFSKAKKSSPRSGVSKTERAVKSFSLRHNKIQESSVLSDEHCKVIQHSSINISNKAAPVNGAVFCSESKCTESKLLNKGSSVVNSEIVASIQLFRHKSPPKSKKSFSFHNLVKRTAKKSSLCPNSRTVGQYFNYNVPLSYAPNCSDSYSILKHSIGAEQEYVRLKSMEILKKRRTEIDDIDNHKRTKKDQFNSVLNNTVINNSNSNLEAKSRFVALKTFKKPFTAAKKSVLDSREVTSLKNTALKTFVPKTHLMKRGLKSLARKQVRVQSNESTSSDIHILPRNVTEKDVNMTQNSELHGSSESLNYFKPEICEIRILPNDYLKRASSFLLNASKIESETVEDNMSDEETKLSSRCSSPLKELMSLRSPCSCSAKEVPCICNDGNLQMICEAEDSIDKIVVPCSNSISQQYLLTPSSEIKHRAFCDIHLWRLRQHHCCPICGIFCSQGEFLMCSSDDFEDKENHLFHTKCFLIPAPGLPPGCPHCCKFSNFNSVNLLCKSSADSTHFEVPSNSQNITDALNDCSIFMTVIQDTKCTNDAGPSGFIPGKSELKLMITSLANEKALRLRPTGKCLYNPIKTGDVQKVMQLLANGVNPNHKFKMHSNSTPLHIAAYHGWIGIVHILLQAGAFIDDLSDDLETPLITAVERNQLPIVRYLVHAGAQIDVKDCNGMTSFHIASKNGFKEIAEFLYKTGEININLQDDGGWTALVWACEHKHVGFVNWLLEIGADPNVRDNEENTVLHWAAYSGICEIAELLLERGCTLSYVNKRGDSALHIAAREDNYECVKLFATRGAVLDQKNRENKTPLMVCQDDSLSFNFLCQCISSGTLKLGRMQLEKHVVYRDISRGAEVYPIQAINEVDDEEFIMEFKYVVKNCHKSGVDIISTIDKMQNCYCRDNCLTQDCACYKNSKIWYDTNGCLTPEFDLISPPAIFECNKTCHCPKTCINRVVQHGMRCPLQLFRTQFQGWGVRTLQELPKGAFVCEYVGELITGSEATQRDDDTYFFDLESKDSDYCLDGRYYGNVARFLNHSCEPNLMAVKVFFDHQDLNFPHIAFFTVRDIKPFEELCFDYGLDFWIVKSQAILCTCFTQSCKYSKDTIDDTLKKFFMDTKDENEVQAEDDSSVT